MKQVITVFLIAGIAFIPAFSQDKESPAKEEKSASSGKSYGDNVYFETTLENFETTVYTDKNLIFRVTNEEKGKLSIREALPAPVKDSKKYIGIKVYGKRGDVYTIIPEKELIIDKYCQSISLWIYGKMFSGEVSIYIMDATQKNHRLRIASLNYLGWRKHTVLLPSYIVQEDSYLNQKRSIKLSKIQYRPGNKSRLPKWQYFYIDDISVMVREKYTDRQSDDW